MSRKRTRLLALAALLLAWCLPAAAQWTDPVSQLAREIAAITGPGTVTLTARNVSSLTADNIPVIKHELQNQLRAAGVRVVATNAAAEIRLTLSENVQGYVWVAEVRQSNETKVAMVTAPRPQSAVPMQTGSLVSIRKSLLWSQDAPILDVAVVHAGAEQHLLVLDQAGISLHRMSSGSWTLDQELPIAATRVGPRDQRGRLMLPRDHAAGHLFDAYLPGTVCASSATPPLSLNCRSGDDPWPISHTQTALFGASRNFFTGVITPALGKLTSVPPFYSAAAIPRPTYTLWVFARTDGSVHLMDGVNDVAARERDWGSDLAAVKSSCGAQTQLLVTGLGDSESPDVIRAFEIADREPVEVARPMEFEGPVTALWSSSDGNSAIAVVKNLRSAKYDAYELAITCGQ